MSLLTKLFGDANERELKRYRVIIEQINELEGKFQGLGDSELKKETEKLKSSLNNGKTLDDILPVAFALVREAAKRTLNQRHYDVQLIGGIVLHEGKIAEMKTGEGKTLVATLPVFLNALAGKGVHVVTVNDYLSRRDAAWMGQIYDLLGLKVACLNHDSSYVYDSGAVKEKDSEKMDQERDSTGGFKVVHEFLRPVSRPDAYSADITYGTNNEFGFDYLRDNMVYDAKNIAQSQGHNFALIDEIDSILVDEARTPLIISAPDVDSGKLYEAFAKVVPRLKENEDYNIDEKLRAVSITEGGIEKMEQALNLSNIYEEGGLRYVHHLEQALRARTLYERDKHYVVRDGEVIIVDEFTGRLMPGRRWSEGLHQAVEAKEGVLVQKESRTFATITFQNYFRQYGKLAGMTGTAQTSAEEFHKVYKLDVISVPTNKPMVRTDMGDRIYKTESGKLKAVAKEVALRNKAGQPVLIGTVSITKNELLSNYLKREGVPHNMLNAKNHEQEGQITAQAGRAGTVTVATNMAGRGVDIILGGNPSDKETADNVRKLGGLHVIGTERHEARRIDNQLRGRAGRQGDPGSSQFFVSTEDEVVRIFGGDKIRGIMDRFGVGDDEVIENRLISKAIEQAQSKIEGHNFDIRKHVLEYDDVMNKHRSAIYLLRNEVLRSDNEKEKVLAYMSEQTNALIDIHTPDDAQWNAREIKETFKFSFEASEGQIEKIDQFDSKRDREGLREYLQEVVLKLYDERETKMGTEAMRHLERMLILRVIDELWVDHLEQMEYLRDSVRLRAYGQRDPLVEYKVEGQKMFNRLESAIASQVSNLIFKVGHVHQQSGETHEKRPEIESATSKTMAQESKRSNQVQAVSNKIGRNDPCSCGSGKKYKKCHGA